MSQINPLFASDWYVKKKYIYDIKRKKKTITFQALILKESKMTDSASASDFLPVYVIFSFFNDIATLRNKCSLHKELPNITFWSTTRVQYSC